VDSDGKMSELIGIERNIEDRKKLEIELQHRNEELKSLNHTKDIFFSIIAHDLRNPFTAILNISEMFFSDYDKMATQHIKRNIDSLYRTSQQTHRLMENLLEWSRSSSGSMQYEPHKTDIKELILNCIENIKSNAEAKSIAFVITEQTDTFDVICDSNMIQTIVRNLLTNAVKFSFKESTIKIVISDYSEDKEYCQISVIDNGVGIPVETIPKLFAIDSKVSTKGTEHEHGTGLGLILCKEFIDKHNTKI